MNLYFVIVKKYDVNGRPGKQYYSTTTSGLYTGEIMEADYYDTHGEALADLEKIPDAGIFQIETIYQKHTP